MEEQLDHALNFTYTFSVIAVIISSDLSGASYLMSDALLRTFVAISRHGSLTDAADDLGVSQPALSKRIKDLEDHLRCRLFDRHGRGVRLTRSGEELLARLAPAFLEIDSALEEISHGHESGSGLVAIASIHTLNSYFIPPVIEAFRQEHPYVRFRVLGRSSADVVDLTRRGIADLGIVYGTLVLDEDVNIVHLYDEEIVIAYSSASDRRVDLAAGRLPQNVPIVTFPRGYALRALVERVTAGLSAEIRCEAETLDALVSLVELNVGVSLLPLPAIQERIAEGRILTTRFSRPVTRQVVLISRKTEVQPPVINALRRYVAAGAEKYRIVAP